MIQSILFFLFGFLSALMLALMAAPALWRRAERLTRRQVEATVPLSLNEIQADKDRLRAESAMAVRSLEMSGDGMRERNNHLMLEIGRQKEDLRVQREESLVARETNARLAAEGADLRQKLGSRDDELAALADRHAGLQEDLSSLRSEHADLNGRYGEAMLTSSTRQVDLVAREAEIEKLSHELGLMRGRRGEMEIKLKEAAAVVRSTQEVSKHEARKSAEMQKRLDKSAAALADREERLSRLERDLARLKDDLRETARQKTEAVRALGEADKQRQRELAAEQKAARAAQRQKAPDGDAALREQIASLSAQVVAMAAELEGDGSLLADLAKGGSPSNGGLVSLADRVRLLREQAVKRKARAVHL